MYEIQVGPPGHVPNEELLRRAVETALQDHGADAAEISVTLLDDVAIQALNREHLDHDWVTDVVSFALWEEGEPVLGDVYIGVAQACRQAREADVSLAEELVRLAVHGTLHVLGHDHPEDPKARASSAMYQLQERLVQEVLSG